MEVPELERLVAMVQSASISELTLRQGDSRITIRKSKTDAEEPGMALVAFEGESGYSVSYEQDECAPAAEVSSDILVHAHLVGVFHHVKPIVGLGATVSEGQVIGIIEAMKLVNEVTAPSFGTVVDLLIEDGMPVEYGQALFLLRPDVSLSNAEQ